MATGLYVKAKENLLNGNFDLLSDRIEVALVAIGVGMYEPDLTQDVSIADIPPEAIIAKKTLDSKSIQDAVFSAADVLFPSLESEIEVGAVVLYKNASILSSSFLLFINDGEDEPVTPFPVAPDGTDFTVVWPSGAQGIFEL